MKVQAQSDFEHTDAATPGSRPADDTVRSVDWAPTVWQTGPAVGHGIDWSFRTELRVGVLEGYRIACGSLSPDGQWAAAAYDYGLLRVLDTETGLDIAALCGHTDGIVACTFLQDNRLILSASADGTIRLWDVIDRREVARYRHYGRARWHLCVDGRRAIGVGESAVSVWRFDGRTAERSYSETGVSVTSFAVSESADRLLLVRADGTCEVRDATDLRLIATRPAPGTVRACALSDDGERAVIVGDSRDTRIWYVAESREEAWPGPPHTTAKWARFSPDGRSILMLTASGSLDLFNLRTGNTMLRHSRVAPFAHACVDSAFKRVMAWDVDDEIQFLSLGTGDDG